MGDFTDLCVCGEKKPKISKKCINCIINKPNPRRIPRDNPTGPTDLCACGKTKLKISLKCLDCIKGPSLENPKKCKNCKNHAKMGSDLCGPCQKVERGICGKKDCNNRVSKSKGHRYCGVHLPPSKSSSDFKICAHCNSYAPRGQKLCARCKSGHKTSTINSSKSQIQCRVCKKTLQPRSVGERAARGTAGAGMGTVVGGIIGSLAGPLGTVIGAGLGGFFGSTDGNQIPNLCENCCGLCENKKSECICNHIIGSCRSCGCNVTWSNSSNGYCWKCQGPWFGDDL